MINERQPNLVPETEEASRVVGSKGGLEAPHIRMSTAVKGLMVAGGIGMLLEGGTHVVTARDEVNGQIEGDETATPTPRPTQERNQTGDSTVHGTEVASIATAAVSPTPTEVPNNPDATPTPRPTVGETAVALAPAETIATTLNGYPTRVEFQPPQSPAPITVELNPNRLRPFVGTDGRIIVPGYYTERPANLGNLVIGTDQVVEGQQDSVNGITLDYDYIVGYVSAVTAPYGGPNIFVSFPARYVDSNGRITQESSNKHYATTWYGAYGQGNQMYAVNPENGLLVPPVGNAHYNFGTNQNSELTMNSAGYATFPSSEGVQRVQVGDPIVVTVIRNAGEIGRQTDAENGNLTTEQVIANLLDNDPSNDPHWYAQYNPSAPPVIAQQIIYMIKD